MIFLAVLLISSLLDVIYFLPIVKTAFFDAPEEASASTGSNGSMEMQQPLYLFMVVPLAVTALFSVVFCFYPEAFYLMDLAQVAVTNLF